MPEPLIVGTGAARARARDARSTEILADVRRWLAGHKPGPGKAPDVPTLAGIIRTIDEHLGPPATFSDPDFVPDPGDMRTGGRP